MTSPIMTSDPIIALAVHQLDMETVNADADAQDLRAARSQEQTALRHQIDELHEAARHVRTGALVQGAFSVAGAAAGMAGSFGGGTTATELKSTGAAASALAAPMGRWAGDKPEKDHDANAKLAEAHVADARARAEEANHRRERTEQASDRILSTLDTIVNSDAQGNLAIIANV
jgi:hypothetical protein